MNDCWKFQEIPTRMTTAEIATARPTVVKIVRTGRCTTFFATRVMNRTNGPLYGPRRCSTGCAANKNVAHAVPNFLEFEIAQHPAGNRLDVERSVALHHVGEGITQVHYFRDEPAVESRNSQFVAKHA